MKITKKMLTEMIEEEIAIVREADVDMESDQAFQQLGDLAQKAADDLLSKVEKEADGDPKVMDMLLTAISVKLAAARD